MEIQLVRHATLRVTYANRTLLVDPMLSRAGELAATPNTPNQRPNPLVELPVPAESVIVWIDAVLVTHIHRDHFDQAAADLLPKRDSGFLPAAGSGAADGVRIFKCYAGGG